MILEAVTRVKKVKTLSEWEERGTNVMFRSTINYLHRVEKTAHFFLSVSRNADLELHIQDEEALRKLCP